MDGGRLLLTVSCDPSETALVTQARLESLRPLSACRVLIGKPAVQAVALVPLLFALCGRAQAAAAQAAVATACGESLTVDQKSALVRAVQAETVQEILHPMLMDWLPLAGEAADVATMAAVRATVAQVIKGGAGDELGAVVRPLLPPVSEGLEGLTAWSQRSDSPLAVLWRTLAHWVQAGVLTAQTIPTLGPQISAAEIAALWPSQEHEARAFCAAPLWQGQAVEMGPLADEHAHPLVQQVCHTFGYGPLARLAARLVAVERAARAVIDPEDTALSAVRLGAGCGVAVVKAARGPLAHRVAITDSGIVADWQILAPTEWTFHPHAPWLAGLVGRPRDEALKAAQWAVATRDPCVPCEVRMVSEPGPP